VIAPSNEKGPAADPQGQDCVKPHETLGDNTSTGQETATQSIFPDDVGSVGALLQTLGDAVKFSAEALWLLDEYDTTPTDRDLVRKVIGLTYLRGKQWVMFQPPGRKNLADAMNLKWRHLVESVSRLFKAHVLLVHDYPDGSVALAINPKRHQWALRLTRDRDQDKALDKVRAVALACFTGNPMAQLELGLIVPLTVKPRSEIRISPHPARSEKGISEPELPLGGGPARSEKRICADATQAEVAALRSEIWISDALYKERVVQEISKCRESGTNKERLRLLFVALLHPNELAVGLRVWEGRIDGQPVKVLDALDYLAWLLEREPVRFPGNAMNLFWKGERKQQAPRVSGSAVSDCPDRGPMPSDPGYQEWKNNLGRPPCRMM